MDRLWSFFRFRGVFLMLSLFSFSAFGQGDYTWVNPLEKDALRGRIESETTLGFNRLPNELKDRVRKPVWDLSTQSAGLYLNFNTTASSFQVRYVVKGALSMAHMPTTGVSGLDLYAYDKEAKKWLWGSGNYSFGDTITYTYKDIGQDQDRMYELYLPLYNSLIWLEIGIPTGESISFVKEDKDPIIVYGTSIAQGACASRPGLAWTNILRRKTNSPVVNLGFSGNGRLEKPVLDFIAARPAKAIILDCLPNLNLTAERSDAQVDSLIYHAFHAIRKRQQTTPIILTENSSGFNAHIMNEGTLKNYEQTIQVARKTFERLVSEGMTNIYLLTNSEIGLDMNSTVDYVHPNDLGMMKIATAYTRLLQKIED